MATVKYYAVLAFGLALTVALLVGGYHLGLFVLRWMFVSERFC